MKKILLIFLVLFSSHLLQTMVISNSNEYKFLALENQEKKDGALKKTLEDRAFYDPQTWPLQSAHIARAIYCGANPNIIHSDTSALEKAAMKQDQQLCETLFAHNANPNLPVSNQYPLFCVRSRKLAKLFLSKGVDITVRQNGLTLLDKAMGPEYEAELVALCRQKGLSPLTKGQFNTTALHRLAYSAADHDEKELKKKLYYLFYKLSSPEKQQLIGIVQTHRGTALAILQTQGQNTSTKLMIAYLQLNPLIQ